MNAAMVYGIPIITGPADGTELDIIIDKVTGILINNMNEVTLMEKMHWSVLHPERVTEMGRNAKNHILKKCSFDNMIKNIKKSVYAATSINT